jgi:hypothetical protein
MTKDEALRLALEALTNAYWPTDSDLLPAHNVKECGEAITAIKEALVNEALEKMAENARELGLDYEPAQEPVAWNAGIPLLHPKMKEGETISVEYVELTPPQQDGECKYCTDGCPACDARKLPEQEPVAWIWEKEDGYTSIETHSLDDEDMKNVGVKNMKPLYAKPQFIGLTEDEILLISADCAATHQHTDIHFARAIEAALKAKNT